MLMMVMMMMGDDDDVPPGGILPLSDTGVCAKGAFRCEFPK